MIRTSIRRYSHTAGLSLDGNATNNLARRATAQKIAKITKQRSRNQMLVLVLVLVLVLE
jgi:hypothetical protein